MSKTIEMTRSELVWETRRNEFGAKDWEDTVAWLKGLAEKQEDTSWYRDHRIIYNAVKDLTWDEVYEDFKRWYVEGEDAEGLIYWELVYEGWGYDENHNWVKMPENDRTYKQYLGDFLREIIQEDNYDADIDDYDYAGDYEEEISFSDED